MWQLDNLKLVKTFDGQRFNDVKEMLRSYDMVHSRQNPLPQGWMQLDIRLGNLSLTMEESNFMKAEVDADQSNAVKRMEEVKSDEDDQGDKKRINLGQDLVGMLL